MASKPPQNHSKPTSSNRWDRPPPLPVGDALPDEIYRAVGFALSRWEGLENVMAALFALYCESTAIAPQLAYGSAVAFGTRRDMLVAASRGFFSRFPDDKKKSDKIIEQIGKLSKLRNDVAHGIVQRYDRLLMKGWYLAPPNYNFNKNKFWIGEGSAYYYTADQINDFRVSFDVYRRKVDDYRRILLFARASWLEKHREPLTELVGLEFPRDASSPLPAHRPGSWPPSPLPPDPD